MNLRVNGTRETVRDPTVKGAPQIVCSLSLYLFLSLSVCLSLSSSLIESLSLSPCFILDTLFSLCLHSFLRDHQSQANDLLVEGWKVKEGVSHLFWSF